MMLPKRVITRDKKLFRLYGENSSVCEVCGSPAVDIHHIKLKSQGGGDEHSNLIALCRYHHELGHSKDAKEWRNKFLKIKGL